jgi:hypothetical protein
MRIIVAIRPVALGRRNWIHVGSKEAGPRVAAIISVVATCRRLKIPVRDYLGSVPPGLGGFPITESPNSHPLLGRPKLTTRIRGDFFLKQRHAAWLGETDGGNLKALLVPSPDN